MDCARRETLNACPVLCSAAEEADHFIDCPECGQPIDCRRLGDVLHHEEPGHVRLPADVASDRGIGR